MIARAPSRQSVYTTASEYCGVYDPASTRVVERKGSHAHNHKQPAPPTQERSRLGAPPRTSAGMNIQLVNVLLLGAAFHLIFFAFQTSVFIQQTVVNSVKSKPEYHFKGDGYISLCITYTVFALSNWLAPSMIALTGTKYGMFLGALTYVLYSASFIYPTTSLFYAAAALIGLGAGPLWTAQGSYLSANSDPASSSKHAAIFWSLLQSSILFGNIFVYLALDNGQTTISDQTRYIVYGVLTFVCSLGALVLLCLRGGGPSSLMTTGAGCESAPTALGQLVGALRLARTRNMMLLAFAFLFTGQLLSFFTGVYGTAIGATSQFGPQAKKYIGLSGVLIGVGEILGGCLFGLLGHRTTGKLVRRDSIFLAGYLITMLAMGLVYINLPPDSSILGGSTKPAIIEPRVSIAMLSSALIGFGDACFNTQIYSLLMSVYASNSVAAFALFKFIQSLGSALAFLYSTTLDLHYQIYILSVISSIATVSFCLVEWSGSHESPANEKSGSQQDIISKPQAQRQRPLQEPATSANGKAHKRPNYQGIEAGL